MKREAFSDFLAEKSTVFFGADDIRLYDRVLSERADVYRRFSFGRGFQYISRIKKVCNSICELCFTARCRQTIFFAKVGKLLFQIIKAAESGCIQFFSAPVFDSSAFPDFKDTLLQPL